MGSSRGNAIQAEERENANASPKKQAQMVSNVLSWSNLCSYIFYDYWV